MSTLNVSSESPRTCYELGGRSTPGLRATVGGTSPNPGTTLVEALIEQRAPDLQRQVRPFRGPSHRLALARPRVDEMIHARFGQGGGDPTALARACA